MFNTVRDIAIAGLEIQEEIYIKRIAAKRTSMKNELQSELEKLKSHIIVEIIEYMPNAVVSKTIIKKTTGNVTVLSLSAGEELSEKTSPYDTYIQIIDGAADININDRKYKLRLGEGIIIPSHARHSFNATEQFKMLSTTIKSGYED
jgi:quercetin dioxygenase-like cupin family protein